MGTDSFDDVTRAAAGGLSRRRVFRLLLGGAVGAVLVRLGIRTAERENSRATLAAGSPNAPSLAASSNHRSQRQVALTPKPDPLAAQEAAQSAIADAQQALQQPGVPPDLICARLLEARARVLSIGPAGGFGLEVALAQIDALLLEFGCPAISGEPPPPPPPTCTCGPLKFVGAGLAEFLTFQSQARPGVIIASYVLQTTKGPFMRLTDGSCVETGDCAAQTCTESPRVFLVANGSWTVCAGNATKLSDEGIRVSFTLPADPTTFTAKVNITWKCPCGQVITNCSASACWEITSSLTAAKRSIKLVACPQGC